MRAPDFCLCETKGADQLCSNCTADQGLCFRYTDSTIPLLLIDQSSSFRPSSVTTDRFVSDLVGYPRRPVFSRRDSYICDNEFHEEDINI